jgi:hypothetical protein
MSSQINNKKVHFININMLFKQILKLDTTIFYLDFPSLYDSQCVYLKNYI